MVLLLWQISWRNIRPKSRCCLKFSFTTKNYLSCTALARLPLSLLTDVLITDYLCFVFSTTQFFRVSLSAMLLFLICSRLLQKFNDKLRNSVSGSYLHVFKIVVNFTQNGSFSRLDRWCDFKLRILPAIDDRLCHL